MQINILLTKIMTKVCFCPQWAVVKIDLQLLQPFFIRLILARVRHIGKIVTEPML